MLAKFIKQLRKKHSLTQEFLASKIGISRPTYLQIEKGERDLTITEAQKLADIFGVLFDDFTQGKETPAPKIVLEKKAKPKEVKQEARISVPQENIVKLKETLLYILEKIGALPNIGEAVICKILYFIDFDYYEKYEEQLIGATYIKNHHGPTPAAFTEIIKQMELDDDLIRVVKKYFQYDQKKYLPRRKADLSVFSAREKELIDEEIERFKDFNASRIKEYSHKDVPWIGAEDLQPISYEAVFCRTPEFSVRQYGDEL
ncbi:XRE family transcriptional regulator [bacterium (Candidatus Gribaldobacteria) CG_4_8_14_3_um_filter_42_11]|uniref:XRE family transcriptional regulator n=2 Tax=Candidatus Gribaldobacteria TaxID=2798536 RepID=A0A2H0UVM1_9BACT|nr:MAG: XRE family transcriptional regulator [bacterium (Candidatus Gribaldobacteria) CG10_big_fil_rev_8_21_14_0_10_41_12]PIX03072.1 MAG: XRE family transcriptional regulator [bacterium (Candidatus Gribaldobacteria) CG_4_8_14_3_um_filter_42_11]